MFRRFAVRIKLLAFAGTGLLLAAGPAGAAGLAHRRLQLELLRGKGRRLVFLLALLLPFL